MPTPHAEGIIQKAKDGVKPSPRDRKYAVSYLMATSPDDTNVELARMFQVSERQIRDDKKEVRQRNAKNIKEEDISLVIADIAMTLERQMVDLERSKKKCEVGSVAYLRHCAAIHEMQLKSVAALQELGYYPKNLGSMVVRRFEYTATVHKDGSLETRPTDFQVMDAEYEQVGEPAKALPAPAPEGVPQ